MYFLFTQSSLFLKSIFISYLHKVHERTQARKIISALFNAQKIISALFTSFMSKTNEQVWVKFGIRWGGGLLNKFNFGICPTWTYNLHGIQLKRYKCLKMAHLWLFKLICYKFKKYNEKTFSFSLLVILQVTT